MFKEIIKITKVLVMNLHFTVTIPSIVNSFADSPSLWFLRGLMGPTKSFLSGEIPRLVSESKITGKPQIGSLYIKSTVS